MLQKTFFTSLCALICLGMYLCFISNNFKILGETKNKFIFKMQTTFSWSASVFFGGLALASILFSLTISPLTILNCTHSYSKLSTYQANFNTNCELTAFSWLGKEQSKIIIPELQEAILEAKLDNKDSKSLFERYRVVLVSVEKNIPLINSYIYSDEPEYQNLLNIMSQINSFLDHFSKDTLTIYEEYEKLLGYTGFAIGAFFGLVTFLILVLTPSITCSFERELNLVTIERCNLFGKKIIENKTSDITAVKVEDASEESTYRLVLMLSSGEKLPLTYFFTSGWKEKQQMANRLQNFLEIKNLGVV